ncbi:bifunctional Pseudouridine synthase TruA-RsuA-RluB-E-F [Babesia duncani]|uniref:Bifunctional Pseudouridine synthase TruA-RsuA-RluB-E-F n=1 Tax=Babesia duncani TaxID=323732 RepID=A0AAD9PNU3_9APIC|nr:bifunctional Pseudouridine synthase TruA-RsuA-RluB-E-F [Babesia duncani]
MAGGKSVDNLLNETCSNKDELHGDDMEYISEACDSENFTRGELTLERPKTNLVLIVSYDGTKYGGFVGPALFLNEYLTRINCTDSSKYVKTNKTPHNSVTNEILRAICMVHGYLRKRHRKDKEDNTETSAKESESNVIGSESFQRRFTLIPSSRTDKGVHATETACQYLSFDKELPCNGNLKEFQDAVNSLLPNDIRILSLATAPSAEGFRKMSRGNERDRIIDPICTIKDIKLERIDLSNEKK